jgi:chemotaxis protein CheX
MDVSIINPFLVAAVNLFENMFGITAVPGTAYVLADEKNHRWEISGILGITGDYQGLVGFRLPRLLADKMLLKSEITTKTEAERLETLYGMIGELTNIISGNATSAIEHASIDICPPIVVLGKNHQISWPKTMPVIAIPFTTSNGPFEVDVCFKKK